MSTQLEVNLAGIKVGIGFPNYSNMISMETFQSLIEAMKMMSDHKIPHEMLIVRFGSLVDSARNQVVQQFLESDCTHLFWIDSDQAFAPEGFFRVLCFAQVYDIVGAPYQTKQDPGKVFMSYEKPPRFNEHGLLEAHGSGMGFVCMTRKVIETLADGVPWYGKEGTTKIPYVFRNGYFPEYKQYFGEDHYFFTKAREAGFKYVIDPSFAVGHVGMKVYRHDPQGLVNTLKKEMEDDRNDSKGSAGNS